jgi:hypothetical protein
MGPAIGGAARTSAFARETRRSGSIDPAPSCVSWRRESGRPFWTALNRSALERILRGAAAATNVAVGNQAVLGQFPNTPQELLAFIEADVFPRGDPAKAILIEAPSAGCLHSIKPSGFQCRLREGR